MLYRDLDTEKAKRYILECTDLFPRDATLFAYEFGRNERDGDGYVNYVFRVWEDKGRSVIIKQSKPYLKIFGEGVFPLSVQRNNAEADIIKIRSAITPEFVPALLHKDSENNLYICEDCGHLNIMRFELSKGKRFPLFPEQIAAFMAKNHFYTSELYLDPKTHKALDCRFTNPDMRLIMEKILFLRDPLVDSADFEFIEPDALHRAASDVFWEKRDVRIELLKLRDVYMKKHECLVHGDLHTSNIMINEREMRVFDMEYAHMGPYSADSGYLLGNLLYTYITWFYHDEWTEAERARYREDVLGYIKGCADAYFRVFTECWKRDAKDIFRQYPEYLDDLYATHIKEMCGFMGTQISSRVGGYTDTPDFNAVANPHKRNQARALAMVTAYNLIMKRNEMSSIDDIIELVQKTAAIFHQLT